MAVVEDHKMDGLRDEFPVGMRVLAVDDDSTCLMILEAMLRRCKYHVTSTKDAKVALNLLRGNKNKFDLVISDVQMPDMDGFKLLEIVGLEMDLPVIMLSAHGDHKMVTKGIRHGACDYLLKPVRIQEIQNIWKHVVKRNTIDSKKRNTTIKQDKANADSNERVSLETGNSDQNGKSSRKRKDEGEDEEHENGHDNENSSSHKKPRVVWTSDLHLKFVAAVNQLGFEKAVPKKILDLMNVEKLTRENVASHLQKYRLYLKRINFAANQKANMVADLGTADSSSYLRMCSLNRVGHLGPLTSSQQFQNNTFRPFGSDWMTSRLNTSVGVNVHGLPSSETPQLGHAQNLHKSIHDPLNFQPAVTCGNQNGIQGMSMSTGLDQFQHSKGFQPNFSMPNKLLDMIPKVTIGCSPSPVLDISNNALVLKAESENIQGSGVTFGQNSLAFQHSQFSLPLLDQGRCSDIWSNSFQSCETNSYPPSENFQVRNLSGASSITTLSNQSPDSLKDIHSQGVFPNNYGQISNNAVTFQGWNDNDDSTFHSNIFGNSVNSLVDTDGHNSINSTYNRNMDFSFFDPLLMKNDEIKGLSEENTLKQQQGQIMNQNKSQSNCAANNLGSLEEFVSSMVKQKPDDVKLWEGYLCDNIYSDATFI